jgi:phosphoglycolate phosphatase
MKLPPPKAIIFDWDNTLVNTWPVIHEALNKTFVQMGRAPWSMEMVQRRVARSMRDSFPAVFGDSWQAAAEIYQQSFRAIHLERLEALPGAASTLAYLQGKPVYVAIASNKKGVNLRKETAHIGWERYFSKVIGADDTPRDKPAPEPVYAALEGSGITADRSVWFVGDSEIDMECAYATGCTAILYGELPQEPLQYPHAAQVRDHSELMTLFEGIYRPHFQS